jgi:hypothetical protein
VKPAAVQSAPPPGRGTRNADGSKPERRAKLKAPELDALVAALNARVAEGTLHPDAAKLPWLAIHRECAGHILPGSPYREVKTFTKLGSKYIVRSGAGFAHVSIAQKKALLAAWQEGLGAEAGGEAATEAAMEAATEAGGEAAAVAE